jgi:hypothetical protein
MNDVSHFDWWQQTHEFCQDRIAGALYEKHSKSNSETYGFRA